MFIANMKTGPVNSKNAVNPTSSGVSSVTASTAVRQLSFNQALVNKGKETDIQLFTDDELLEINAKAGSFCEEERKVIDLHGAQTTQRVHKISPGNPKSSPLKGVT